MLEKLIALLGMKPESTEEQVLQRIDDLKRASVKVSEGGRLDKLIADKIRASGGSLSREQAILALQHQEANDEAKGSEPSRK